MKFFSAKTGILITLDINICIIILVQLIFENYQSVEMLKYEVLILIFYGIYSTYYLMKNYLHPYIIFMGTFFLFLCSRIFLDIVGMGNFAETTFFSQYTFSTLIQIKILLILITAISFSNMGIHFSRGVLGKEEDMSCKSIESLRKFSLFLMCFSLVPSVIAYYQIIQQVMNYGYVYIYTSNFEKPALINFFTLFQIGYYTFLASIPPKRMLVKYTFLYSILLSMTLLVGARSLFATSFLILIVYYHTYINKIRLKKILLVALSIIFLLQFVSWFRISSMDVSNIEIDNEFVFHFLREQGVSITVIGYTEQFKNEVYHNELNYIFNPFISYITEKTKSGKREIGDSIDISLADKISYLANSKMYFSGFGTGNSFVAELYADGGILFVALGCFILGWMINYTFVKFKNHYMGIIALCYLWSGFFFMSRGTYFGNILEMIKGLLFVAIFYPIFSKITKLKYK